MKKHTVIVRYSLFLLLFLNVIFLYFFLFFRNTVEIKLTDSGFLPSQTVVVEGERVIFRNESPVLRWPASDLHPTHKEYPAFDPQQGLAPQSEWEFVPTQIGEWKFHDHLSPHTRGVLTVRKKMLFDPDYIVRIVPIGLLQTVTFPTDEIARVKLQSFLSMVLCSVEKKHCSGANNPSAYGGNFMQMSQKAQLMYLERMAESDGSIATWDFVKKTYASIQGETGGVHDLAHFSGELMYKEMGLSGISNCTAQFAFGCYHGLLDAAFKNDLSKLDDAVAACEEVGVPGSGPYASCIHGIGHGVASYYGVRDLEGSLRSCDELPLSASNYCHDGVFMEFARNAPKDFYKESDPLYPCSEVGEKYIFSCGRNQTSVMMGRFGYSFEQIVQICLAGTNTYFTNSCADSMGFVAAYSSPQSPKGILSKCQEFDSEVLIGRCMRSSAGELIFQNMQSWQVNAPLVCGLLNGQEKTMCSMHIERIMADYGRR
jgi:hypothetical protein